MRSFQYLIFILFGGLAFLSPQDAPINSAALQQDIEIIPPSNNHKNVPAVEALSAQLHQIFDTSQTPELQFAKQFQKAEQPNAVAHEPKLLYYNIGNAIELHLSSTTIIFPFHCFT